MKQLRTIHKWMALIFGAFWILQAASGALLVFHRELGDYMLTDFSQKDSRPQADPMAKLDAAITNFRQQNPAYKPIFLINSGGGQQLFDIVVETPAGEQKAYRFSADGTLYKTYYWYGSVSQMGFFRALLLFHTELLSGHTGHWIVGLNGIMLATTLILGLRIGWPRKGTVKQVLRPRTFRNNIAGLYAWHRAAGLWIGFVLLCIAISGVLLVWVTPLRDLLGTPSTPTPSTVVNQGEPTSLAEALDIARAPYPNSSLAVVTFPQETAPYYKIRLTQQEENRRIYGTTTIYVSQRGSRILSTYDPLNVAPKYRFLDGLYPFHTGEIWGIGGRIAYILIALCLIATAYLGISLFYKKSARQKGPRKSGT